MDHLIAGPPTLSQETFTDALEHRQSPAFIEADLLWETCLAWGVNPAVALAFFVHESSAGTAGIAVRTKNWGNLRAGPGAYTVDQGFAWYACWVTGLNDWCSLLRGDLYERAGLRTVSQVTPRYAPSDDANNPVQYAQAVNAQVDAWAAMG